MTGQDTCQREDQLDHSDQAIRVNMKKGGLKPSVVVNMHGMISI